MGESKKRNARPELTEDTRAAMLGDDPFHVAYEFLFGMVQHVYAGTAGVTHQLMGMDFQAGKVSGVSTLVVRRAEDVPQLRKQMLQKWPMVAHVFEAWAAPDVSAAPSKHPLRYDVVSILMQTSDMVVGAMCRVDPGSRSVERGELIYPTEVGGRLSHGLPSWPSERH